MSVSTQGPRGPACSPRGCLRASWAPDLLMALVPLVCPCLFGCSPPCSSHTACATGILSHIYSHRKCYCIRNKHCTSKWKQNPVVDGRWNADFFFVYVFWLVTTVSTGVEVEIYGFVVAVVVVKYKNSLREVFGLRHQLSLFILHLPLQNKKKNIQNYQPYIFKRLKLMV